MARRSECAPVALLCLAMLVRYTVFSGTSFLEALSTPRPNFERPWASQKEELRMQAGGFGRAMPMAGLVAAGLAAAVRASVVRRKAEETEVVPIKDRKWGTGPDPEMMPETYDSGDVPFPSREMPEWSDEMAEWWNNKLVSMKEKVPWTEDEFDDQADETWDAIAKPGMRRQTDAKMGMGRRQSAMATRNKRTILAARETFKKARLFKPLAMKHPLTFRQTVQKCKWGFDNWDIDPLKIENTETTAGFTYEDFLEATTNNTFEDWGAPDVGDIVSGTVMAINEEKGVQVDIGAKCWAYLPLENCSLFPVAKVSEAQAVKLGAELEFEVVDSNQSPGIGKSVAVRGDSNVDFVHILSLKKLQKTSAWEKIREQMQGGGKPIAKVVVQEMQNYGASVLTEDGLLGYITSQDLGAKAGDSSLMGQSIDVVLKEVRWDNLDNDAPRLASDYPLWFSYVDMAARVLAESLEEGQVVGAKIVGISNVGLELEVNGVVTTVSKVNITNNPKMVAWNIEDYFRIGEEIKAYVMDVLPASGTIRLSTRFLEKQPLDILNRKKMVFEEAEETAKLKFEAKQKEKLRMESALESQLGESLGSEAESDSNILGGDSDDELDF